MTLAVLTAPACRACRGPITSPSVPRDRSPEPRAILCGRCVSRALVRMATMRWQDPVGNSEHQCPEERNTRVAEYESRLARSSRRAKAAKRNGYARARQYAIDHGSSKAKARVYAQAIAVQAEGRSWERERPLAE